MHDRFDSRGMAAARFVAQRLLMKPFIWSITTARVVGAEHPVTLAGAPFVLVANHTSHLDAPLLFGALPRRQARWLAAGAAADYFFDVVWRRGLTALFFNAFAVSRAERDAPAPGEAARSRRPGVRARSLLERGIPLLVFPEGTRSRDGALAVFKPGAAALAISAGVPCLPAAILGAAAAHPRGSRWPRAGRPPVAVAFGAPMRARPGERPDVFTARLRDEVARLSETNAGALLPRTADSERGKR